MKVIKAVCLGDRNVRKTKLLSVLSGKQCDCNDGACIHCKVQDYFTCNILEHGELKGEIRLFNTVDSVCTF